MANPLEAGSVSPPAPNPDAGNALQQGAPQQQQQAPAPPTHEQTIAALRHFDAVKGELQTLLKNPALGKSSVKSQVIDGVTKLVSERMLSPAQAVIQLSQVPEDPLAQRKWIQMQMGQAVQAENAVLDHYGQGNPSMLDNPQQHVAMMDHGKRDDHSQHMQALATNYGGR